MIGDPYNGWVNWETWNWSVMVLDNDSLYHRGREDAEGGYEIKTIREMADYLEEDMEEIYSIYTADMERVAKATVWGSPLYFESIFDRYTRTGLGLIDWVDLAESHFETYQDGRRSYLEEIEEEEE